MNELIKTLERKGVEAAAITLDGYDYRFRCLFLADVSESVLPIFEREYQGDERARLLINGVRNYHSGDITEEELSALRNSFYPVSESYNISGILSFVIIAACHAETVVTVAVDAVATSEKIKKQQEIETLFIKHFGDIRKHELILQKTLRDGVSIPKKESRALRVDCRG